MLKSAGRSLRPSHEPPTILMTQLNTHNASTPIANDQSLSMSQSRSHRDRKRTSTCAADLESADVEPHSPQSHDNFRHISASNSSGDEVGIQGTSPSNEGSVVDTALWDRTKKGSSSYPDLNNARTVDVRASNPSRPPCDAHYDSTSAWYSLESPFGISFRGLRFIANRQDESRCCHRCRNSCCCSKKCQFAWVSLLFFLLGAGTCLVVAYIAISAESQSDAPGHVGESATPSSPVGVGAIGVDYVVLTWADQLTTVWSNPVRAELEFALKSDPDDLSSTPLTHSSLRWSSMPPSAASTLPLAESSQATRENAALMRSSAIDQNFQTDSKYTPREFMDERYKSFPLDSQHRKGSEKVPISEAKQKELERAMFVSTSSSPRDRGAVSPDRRHLNAHDISHRRNSFLGTASAVIHGDGETHVSGLDPGAAYFARVRVDDRDGEQSAWSEPTSFHTMQPQRPEAIKSLSLRNTSSTSLTLGWTFPPLNGATLLRFEIDYFPAAQFLECLSTHNQPTANEGEQIPTASTNLSQHASHDSDYPGQTDTDLQLLPSDGTQTVGITASPSDQQQTSPADNEFSGVSTPDGGIGGENLLPQQNQDSPIASGIPQNVANSQTVPDAKQVLQHRLQPSVHVVPHRMPSIPDDQQPLPLPPAQPLLPLQLYSSKELDVRRERSSGMATVKPSVDLRNRIPALTRVASDAQGRSSSSVDILDLRSGNVSSLERSTDVMSESDGYEAVESFMKLEVEQASSDFSNVLTSHEVTLNRIIVTYADADDDGVSSSELSNELGPTATQSISADPFRTTITTVTLLRDSHRPGSEISTSLSNLQPNTHYSTIVRAVNSVGEATWSKPFVVRTDIAHGATSPQAPTEVQCESGADYVEITWKESHDGGAQILAHHAAINASSRGDISIHEPRLRIKALPPMTTFTIQVWSQNSRGNSTRVAVVCTTKHPTLPVMSEEIPRPLIVYTDQIVISWKPASSAGAPLESYRVQYFGGDILKDFPQTVVVLVDVNTTRLEAAIGNLKADTEYKFYVLAENSVGLSEPSAFLLARTEPASKKCGSHSDSSILGRSRVHLGRTHLNCGLKEWTLDDGGKSNYIACIHESGYPISNTCMDCFWEEIQCGVHKCGFKCVFSWQRDSCNACGIEKCSPSFRACMGLGDEYLPMPP